MPGIPDSVGAGGRVTTGSPVLGLTVTVTVLDAVPLELVALMP